MTLRRRLRLPTLVGAVLAWGVANGVDTSDDRILLSADGSTLTNTNGGGGGSAGWLHNVDANTLFGVAGEYQKLSVAHWAFGSVNGALTFGPEAQRYGVYAEAHEGAGDDGPHPFHYRIEAVGLNASYFKQLSALLEDKQIDVEATHGNLPKIGVGYLWNPHLQTSVSYSHSVTGNLGTRLGAVRVDVYGPNLNYLTGVTYGPASAAVLGIDYTVAINHLKEGYVGVSKPLPHWHSEITLIADYQDLSGAALIGRNFSVNDSKRATITLNYIFHVGAGKAR